MIVSEAFLHTIWKYKLLGHTQFKGSKNELIEIVSVGEHNQDSGPDFFNSKIRINDVLLAGNVELHVKTSDWLKHNHQNNKAYNNLVLHVVYEHDVELPQNTMFNVCVLELKQYLSTALIEQYNQLNLSKQLIACGKSITIVPEIIWHLWLDRLVATRLEQKTKYIEQLFNYCSSNHEDALYVLLCRNFGFKINNEAFELLAKRVPYSVLKKHSDQPLQVEALLFGTAGFLSEQFSEKYPQQLQNEFEFLKYKYQLIPLEKEIWKFSKTRPSNFPTIRLAQLASIICSQKSLYHLIEQKPDLKYLRNFFNARPNDYWSTHFKFDVVSETGFATLGDSSFYSIIINTVVPYLFFMSKHNLQNDYNDYAISLLTKIPAEENKKTREYTKLGLKAQNALESQAQIELYDIFCSKKACLHCNVAEHLLKKQL